MPIGLFIEGMSFDPDTRRVIGVAFEMTCTALRLTDCGDMANGFVAKGIIEFAKTGERNPDLLCEGVLKEFRDQQL
jgi:hypothetical protein